MPASKGKTFLPGAAILVATGVVLSALARFSQTTALKSKKLFKLACKRVVLDCLYVSWRASMNWKRRWCPAVLIRILKALGKSMLATIGTMAF